MDSVRRLSNAASTRVHVAGEAVAHAGEAATHAGEAATREAQAWVARTTRKTQRFFEAKGWLGTVSVRVNLPLVTLHGAVPVGGHAASKLAGGAAADDGAAAPAEGAAEVGEKALVELAGYLESAAGVWRTSGFSGGSVGATVHTEVFGVGGSIDATMDVLSIAGEDAVATVHPG